MNHFFACFSPATLCRSVLVCLSLLFAGLTARAQTTWAGATDPTGTPRFRWTLVTNELLTNVLKYAFKGKDTGIIRISLK